MNTPANQSTAAVASYIREYLDPVATLTRDDDAALIVAALTRVWGEDCGVTVDQMAEYIESLSL